MAKAQEGGERPGEHQGRRQERRPGDGSGAQHQEGHRQGEEGQGEQGGDGQHAGVQDVAAVEEVVGYVGVDLDARDLGAEGGGLEVAHAGFGDAHED